MIHFVSGGGGGYEFAHERDLTAVAADIKEGYISREAAVSDYGVVVDDELKVDVAATNALRASRAGQKP